MTTTRNAVTLALVLMTGTAMAAPGRDNFFQRTGKSMKASAHYFQADMKQRNEKAGPGFFKRAAASVGAKLTSMKEGTKENMGLLRDALHDGVQAEKVRFSEFKSNVKSVGRDFGESTAQRFDAAKQGVAKVATSAVTGTKNPAYATKMGVLTARASHLKGVADRAARRASDADLTAFRNERGNEKFNTDYKTSAKENNVGGLRARTMLSQSATVVGAGVTVLGGPLAPVNGGLAVVNAGYASESKQALLGAKRTSAESAVNKNVVPAARITTWAKGGTIDPALAN